MRSPEGPERSFAHKFLDIVYDEGFLVYEKDDFVYTSSRPKGQRGSVVYAKAVILYTKGSR
jgi:hypothetical protein